MSHTVCVTLTETLLITVPYHLSVITFPDAPSLPLFLFICPKMDAKLRSLISKVKKEHDDDSVDRCIYATTVYILGFFAVLIMARQYVGEPLQCWIPAEYTVSFKVYLICFVYFYLRVLGKPT